MNGIDISMASTQKVQCKIANTLTEDYTVDDVENEVRNNAPCVFELTFGFFKKLYSHWRKLPMWNGVPKISNLI